MDAMIEAPTATATVQAYKPTVVAIVVVPDYVPVFTDQGVVVPVLSINGASISSVHGDAVLSTLVEPRLSGRGFIYALNAGGVS